MCLIVFAWKAHPKYPLIVASNRDEFYERPTSIAHKWSDNPEIFGGKDEEAGGTWLAINHAKKLAAVTNYRDLANIQENARSRGELPVNFLSKEWVGTTYMEHMHKTAQNYNGFNLVTFDDENAFHYSNYENKINELKPGIYGLSNAILDTPWPKVELAKRNFTNITQSKFRHTDLIKLMQNDSIAKDEELPKTGLPLDKERALSAMCIKTEGYGTCCTTIITKDQNGHVKFTEQSYAVGGRKAEQVVFELN